VLKVNNSVRSLDYAEISRLLCYAQLSELLIISTIPEVTFSYTDEIQQSKQIPEIIG
jgi:hypothetical protein